MRRREVSPQTPPVLGPRLRPTYPKHRRRCGRGWRQAPAKAYRELYKKSGSSRVNEGRCHFAAQTELGEKARNRLVLRHGAKANRDAESFPIFQAERLMSTPADQGE